MAINTAPIVYTTTGAKDPIIVSRHNSTDTSLQAVIDTGPADYTIEATLDKINRGETPNWFPLPSATNLTANLFDSIKEAGIEAVRMNITTLTAGSITFKVQQNTRG